jgi:hypothetical protein
MVPARALTRTKKLKNYDSTIHTTPGNDDDTADIVWSIFRRVSRHLCGDSKLEGGEMIRSADKELKSVWGKIFHSLSADNKTALIHALTALRTDALKRAEHCWKKHKAPMALYWKVIGVYAGHLARSIK